MKWVKVAIGAVIAILSVGIIATSVYNMTQEQVKDEVLTFEVLTFAEGTGTIYNGAYNDISKYIIVDSNLSTNVKSIKINGSDGENGSNIIFHGSTYYNFSDTFDGVNTDMEIHNDDTIILSEGDLLVGEIIEIVFEVTRPPQLSGINATLILLTPLIFAGGVLAYLLNKQEL